MATLVPWPGDLNLSGDAQWRCPISQPGSNDLLRTTDHIPTPVEEATVEEQPGQAAQTSNGTSALSAEPSVVPFGPRLRNRGGLGQGAKGVVRWCPGQGVPGEGKDRCQFSCCQSHTPPVDHRFGQFSCWCRKSNVPRPWMVCGPLKNSMAVRSPRFSWSYRRRTLAYS